MSKPGEQAAPPEAAAKEAPRFTKEQILASKRYHARRDALRFLLADGQIYSHSEVNSVLKDYLKGAVK